MSSGRLTKAEEHFFDPQMLIDFGIPERCAYCPVLNHKLTQRAISEAFTGEPNLSTSSGQDLARRRGEQRDELIAMADGCGGHEELSGDELDVYVAAYRTEDDLDRESIAVGYRCQSTGEAVVAITYGNGFVGLRPFDPQEEIAA